MESSKDQRILRMRIIGILQLIASREKCINYQREVPIAHVSAELFCLWADDLYADGAWLYESKNLAIFSDKERDAMAKFNEILDAVSDSITYLPDIEEFVLTQEWARLSGAATEALREFSLD